MSNFVLATAKERTLTHAPLIQLVHRLGGLEDVQSRRAETIDRCIERAVRTDTLAEGGEGDGRKGGDWWESDSSHLVLIRGQPGTNTPRTARAVASTGLPQ